MAENKRERSDGDHELAGALSKRAKADSSHNSDMGKSITLRDGQTNNGGTVIMKTALRTSKLQAPIMLLTGHQGEVFSSKFSTDGEFIASSSFDREIFLWKTYGDCTNYNVLRGHTGAVLEVSWSRDNHQLFSVSTDKTLAIWDTATGLRVKKLKGHTSFVNACSVARNGPEILASVSDDCTARIWDIREKYPVHTYQDKYQLTSVALSADSTLLFSGGIDNDIKAWDIRMPGKVSYTLCGHLDTVTGLRVSPDGSQLLSYGMDNSVRTWDIKPFAAGGLSRLLKIFEGAPQGMERHLLRPCWSTNGEMIAAGAADRTVVIWDVSSRKIAYKLPGHKGCVTEVDWHPKEPIVVSCSTDRTLFMGEVDTNTF